MTSPNRVVLFSSALLAVAVVIGGGAAARHHGLLGGGSVAHVNRAVAYDTSGALAPGHDAGDCDQDGGGCGISPPDNDDPDMDEGPQQPQQGTPVAIVTPAGSGAVEQHAQGTKSGPTMIASFDGEGVGFVGPQGTRNSGNPSDNSVAVGPDHIVQIVNGLGIAIFTKKGKKYDTTGKALFGPVAANIVFKGFGGTCEARASGDAVVRYDQLADRWLFVLPIFQREAYRADQPGSWDDTLNAHASPPGIAGQPGAAAVLYQPPPPPPVTAADSAARGRGAGAAGARGAAAGARGRGAGVDSTLPRPPQGGYSMCYAVSTGPDPMGSYYRYEFLRPLFPDYPRPAIWPDGYYVPTSTSDNRISPTIASQKHACVADRAKMLKGEPATEQCVIVVNTNFLENADIDGKKLPPPGAPNIMIAVGGRQLDSIYVDSVVRVWQFHVDWKDSTKTTVKEMPPIRVAPYRFLCNGQLTRCVPQPGAGSTRLDSQGDKLMARFTYRNVNGHEALFGTHSVNTTLGGGGVRWYEFRIGKDRSVTLYQQGTYAPDSNFRWLASGATDKNGNFGIGYSFGGSTSFAGQRFAGRLADDPKGQLTMHETVMVEGQGIQRENRWEDYSQTGVDPSDDCTIWYVGDYMRAPAAGATTIGYTSRIGGFRLPGCK